MIIATSLPEEQYKLWQGIVAFCILKLVPFDSLLIVSY